MSGSRQDAIFGNHTTHIDSEAFSALSARWVCVSLSHFWISGKLARKKWFQRVLLPEDPESGNGAMQRSILGDGKDSFLPQPFSKNVGGGEQAQEWCSLAIAFARSATSSDEVTFAPSGITPSGT